MLKSPRVGLALTRLRWKNVIPDFFLSCDSRPKSGVRNEHPLKLVLSRVDILLMLWWLEIPNNINLLKIFSVPEIERTEFENQKPTEKMVEE